MAETVDGGSALHWRTRRLTSAGTALRGIHSGTAGAVLALAEAVRLGIDGHAATALHRGAEALRDGLGNRPGDGVGLLGGEPGVAVALGRAARALGDMDLLEVASEQLLGLETCCDTNGDLASGAAGIVLVHLEFADLASGPDHLGRGVTLAHRLVDRASVGDDDILRWTSPGADHTDAAIVRPGLQFGTAGVLLALVRLAAFTGDARWRRAAAAAGQGLIADMHGGAAHPGDTARSRTWRNERGVGDHTFADGGAGIAMALGNLDRLLAEHGEPAASPATDRASLLPLFVAARAAGPTLMHGLAGTIVALVDLHSTTGDVAYLDEAHSHSLLLGTWRNATASGVWWGRGDPSPDLATGTAGIVLASCRLAAARLARSATTMPLR
jgi:lantibiotic modifying enzyme